MQLKHSIRILFLAMTLIPFYIFSIFMVYEYDRHVENIMKENLQVISGVQIFDIKRFCEEQQKNMESIGDYELVHDAIKDQLNGVETPDSQQNRYLTNLLSQRKAYNDDIVSLSVLDKNFYVVASTEEYAKNEKSLLEKWKTQMHPNDDFYISNLFAREINGQSTKVMVAYQLIKEKGEVIGYIAKELSSDCFDDNRTETKLWKHGTLYLLDGKNQIITAGKAEGESIDSFITTAEERESYTRAWNAVNLEENPTGSITYTINGQENITYYSTIDYTDWIIRVSVNLEPYTERKTVFQLLIGLTAIIVFAIMVGISRYMNKRLITPIDGITHTLKSIREKQDYSLRVSNQVSDEIGMLALEVNNLLEYVEQENLMEKEQQHHLARKAERDPLTGIKNKRALEENIQDMLQCASKTEKRIAIGFLDVDNFKDYNTKYGHQEGDKILKFVASILEQKIDGIVGRYGGDEFVFAMEDITSAKDVENQMRDILACLNEGIQNKMSEKKHSVSGSIGVVIAKGEHLSYSYLLRTADEAMYRGKRQGKNTIVVLSS